MGVDITRESSIVAMAAMKSEAATSKKVSAWMLIPQDLCNCSFLNSHNNSPGNILKASIFFQLETEGYKERLGFNQLFSCQKLGSL